MNVLFRIEMLNAVSRDMVQAFLDEDKERVKAKGGGDLSAAQIALIAQAAELTLERCKNHNRMDNSNSDKVRLLECFVRCSRATLLFIFSSVLFIVLIVVGR